MAVDEGRVHFDGRSVPVRGVKRRLFEQALMRLPGVAQAVAYPVAHPTLGENVHAAIVPVPDNAAEGQRLRSALFGVVADFKIPACIHVVDRIPLGFMGDGRDTANAALFLASEEARFVTGTEIIVDGGMVARCD